MQESVKNNSGSSGLILDNGLETGNVGRRSNRDGDHERRGFEDGNHKILKD